MMTPEQWRSFWASWSEHQRHRDTKAYAVFPERLLGSSPRRLGNLYVPQWLADAVPGRPAKYAHALVIYSPHQQAHDEIRGQLRVILESLRVPPNFEEDCHE